MNGEELKEMVRQFENRFPFDELSITVMQKMVEKLVLEEKQDLASTPVYNLFGSL